MDDVRVRLPLRFIEAMELDNEQVIKEFGVREERALKKESVFAGSREALLLLQSHARAKVTLTDLPESYRSACLKVITRIDVALKENHSGH